MQGNWGDQPGGGGGGQQPPGGGFGPPPGGDFGPPPGAQPAWGPPQSDMGGGPVGGPPQGIDPVAIAATVCGALALFLCWCGCLGFPLSLAAVGLGIFGMVRAGKPGAHPTSKILSIVGIALGGIDLIIAIIGLFMGLGANVLNSVQHM